MDTNGHRADTLSPEQAAALLGCSARTVRRAIFKGHLAGDIDPYRTSREAVDAFRQRQQGLCGEVLTAVDTPAGHMSMDVRALLEPLAAELASARQQIERLSREVGRLHAELEQARAAPIVHGCAPLRCARQHSGPRAPQRGTLARLGRWLLR